MKKIITLLLLLPAFMFSLAQDSIESPEKKDTIRPALAERLKEFGIQETERSIKKFKAGKIKIEQQAIIEQIKITSQQAGIVINRGFDTLGLRQKLYRADQLLQIAKDGIFENKGSIQTHRNLSVSSVILNELTLELMKEKLELDKYINSLLSFRNKIDSLNSISVLYLFPVDSAEIMHYMNKIRVVSKVISPVDSSLDNSLKMIDELQNQLNFTIYNLESNQGLIDSYIKEVTGKGFQSDVPRLSEPIINRRPIMEIIRFSLAKEKLALQFYAIDNKEKLGFVFLLITMSVIFLKSLKSRVIKEEDLNTIGTDNLVIRFPFASGIIIVLCLFQFIFLEPPFIFSYSIWCIILCFMTIMFRKILSRFWFRFWIVITLLFLLAGANNMVLQVSRTERWFMFFLSVAGSLYGLWILLIGPRRDLKEKKILYFIAFMIVLETLAAIGNYFGLYNLSKTLLVSGFIGLVVAILFLWTVRLINQGLGLISRVYKRPEKNLFYINFNKIGNRAPGIFYVFLIIGWLILVGKNFYAFQRISKSFNSFLNEERVIGNYIFSVNSLFIFFVILFCSLLLSRIISFFADEPDLSNTSESQRKKVRLGSWLLLVQIFVISIGLFLAIAASGIPLDRITIVMGALGVGIGLGLQGLVSNLVSGLVIAFEKPVNVGDSIEVNGKSGIMKSIGFRSSVVSLWDGSSLVIPNSDLLNHQLINWSMGKGLKRISIVLHVAYGTNLEKASQLVLSEISKEERIRTTPNPIVVPKEFGNSSIELEILYWIHYTSNNLYIKGNLIKNIEKTFSAEGIEIPVLKFGLHLNKDSNINEDGKDVT